ncbi:MAG: bifunctional oligoribonuclease/PAP phosphatase NrnA [Clostridia bacterium]|nr:bifunctional oligoribonuclease/PAP phosphatase NrnA [Clostridia bacterium]
MSGFADIIKMINRANDVAIYCHTNPDGDALGSMLALAFALEKKGKKVKAYCDTSISKRNAKFLGSERISAPDSVAHELGISVDSSDLDRLGNCVKSFLSCKSQIAIDHHKSFKRFTEICYVDKDACACAQIIFSLLKEMKLIDKTVAQLLFGGIVTDSGCFAYPSVTPKTHEIAAELMELGFDAADVIYDTFRSTSKARFDLKRRVLQNAKFFSEDKIAVIVFTAEDFKATGTSAVDTEGIINELIDVETVKVAYALSQVGDKNYKLSVRSKNPVDASEIAGLFGGGGHMNAAGCRVNGYLEDILERIVKIANDRI